MGKKVKSKVEQRKKSIKPQVMPPYGKMKADGHTSVRDIQDTGYDEDPKPVKRKVPSQMIKGKKHKENVKSKRDRDISGTGTDNVDVKSRKKPKTMDSKLSRIADKCGYAKLNKDEDKQPKMKKKRK